MLVPIVANVVVTTVLKRVLPKIFAGMGGTSGFSGLGSLFSKGKGLFDLAKANPLVTSLAGGALAGLLQSKGLKDENEDGLDDETGLDIEAFINELRRR